MRDREEKISKLSSEYYIQVLRAFGGVDPASRAIEAVAKSLNEIYRYIEPSFYKGKFLVCKSLDDSLCFDESKGIQLYDKNILLNRISGIIVIQVFDDPGKMILFNNIDYTSLFSIENTLTYHYESNREHFYANGKIIDLTLYNSGSRFASQYVNLMDALTDYSNSMIRKSTCAHFASSWFDEKRLFFGGGGRGSNIPEMFMQLSLDQYLKTLFARGTNMDSSREYNTVGDFNKPKPVDIKIHWKDSNRIALIEIKYIGSVKTKSNHKVYVYEDKRANEGLVQLKGYHDSISTDHPTTIIKSFLVVIDGRRNNINDSTTSISTADGMHFEDVDIVIDHDKEYYNSIQGFEKPIRMFAEPICS